MKYSTYTLQELATIKYGKNQKKVLDENGSVPIYGTGGLMGWANASLYDRASVLIGRKGTIDKVRFVDRPFWTVDTLFYTIVNEKLVLPKYLYYLLELVDLTQLNEGTTIPSLRTETLNRLEFEIPPIEYQEEVLSYIEPIDRKIEINTRINENLEEQAQILVGHYCESNPPNAVLRKILTFVNGFAFQSSSYLPKGTYKVITIKNVQDGRIDSQGAAFINDIPSRMKPECILHIGDVLLSLTGNVGRVGIVSEENLLLNQRVAKFMPSDASLMPYLYFYFRLPSSKTSLETIAKGTAQQNLSPVETLKLEIPFDERAKELSGSLLSLFEKIISNQMQNQKLCNLRDTLLSRLMSGELDVSDLDL